MARKRRVLLLKKKKKKFPRPLFFSPNLLYCILNSYNLIFETMNMILIYGNWYTSTIVVNLRMNKNTELRELS